MKKTINLLIMSGVVFLTACANKEISPEVVTINKVVSEYGMPEVYVSHNNTRYVNVKTKEYAMVAVTKRQIEENQIARELNEKNKSIFSK